MERFKAAEMFVDLLTDSGWKIGNGASWKSKIEAGVDLEATYQDEARELFLIFSAQENHITMIVSDLTRNEFFEFGFQYSEIIEIETAIDVISEWQEQVLVENRVEFLRSLQDACGPLTWEVHCIEEERITNRNIDTTLYIRPMHNK